MVTPRTLADAVRALSVHAPGAGGFVVAGGRDVLIAVEGRRIAGRTGAVTAGDPWHVGSCTKAMTATVLARLRARGLVDFGAGLGEHLPGIPMHPAFAAMPLRAVLRHEAGIRRDPHYSSFMRLRRSRATVTEQRRHIAALALIDAPVVGAGYSNLGYIVSGVVVEAVTGMPWEQAIAREVFAPLGMTGAGFGAPKLPAPVGHGWDGRRWRPRAPGPYADNPRVYAPAGGVHLPLASWARFAVAHLGAVPGYLAPALLEDLHRGGGKGYAAGWVTGRLADGRPILRHTGTNTMWFADIRLVSARGIAVGVACNAFSPDLRTRVLKTVDGLIGEAASG